MVVHCSDTPNERDVTAAEIHRWHKEGNKWDGIGYHRVIRRDGTLEYGRPDYWPGAHVRGHNHHSLGVCLIGRHYFTPVQMMTLATLLKQWRSEYPDARIVGHHNLDPNKTCPNFDAEEWAASCGLQPKEKRQ
nr:N-acetylmuramoyl-L-alanine amidase [Bowmanella dokdonensis]